MSTQNKNLEAAKKRVKELQGYYRHILIFVLVNGFLLLLQSGVLFKVMPDWFPTETYYFDWVNSNILFWGLILVVHTLVVFRHKFPFLKKWEERQIQKYMQEDEEKWR
ncbi:2TM domain-containing protein [Allomuricauda sp. NBRC 101325]|uniref:2TM domain-containing protein n=1 Tax=Allomuricauda sp. NBRC 101325 TaxID=1113758 RepID=UPI0024A0A050|nr:2TM domain-containing protein [Muricauda sp. NBRC 101325]GLU44322.1 hypothetical protein Musp01_19460 [Muricauda sp. NBRC 101325]